MFDLIFYCLTIIATILMYVKITTRMSRIESRMTEIYNLYDTFQSQTNVLLNSQSSTYEAITGIKNKLFNTYDRVDLIRSMMVAKETGAFVRMPDDSIKYYPDKVKVTQNDRVTAWQVGSDGTIEYGMVGPPPKDSPKNQEIHNKKKLERTNKKKNNPK